jgi:hypothetical protein
VRRRGSKLIFEDISDTASTEVGELNQWLRLRTYQANDLDGLLELSLEPFVQRQLELWRGIPIETSVEEVPQEFGIVGDSGCAHISIVDVDMSRIVADLPLEEAVVQELEVEHEEERVLAALVC